MDFPHPSIQKGFLQWQQIKQEMKKKQDKVQFFKVTSTINVSQLTQSTTLYLITNGNSFSEVTGTRQSGITVCRFKHLINRIPKRYIHPKSSLIIPPICIATNLQSLIWRQCSEHVLLMGKRPKTDSEVTCAKENKS